MMWIYNFFNASTEAGFRGVFTTAYHKGHMKMYQKRTTTNDARTVNTDMPNVLRKKMIPFVMRQSSIFMPMFEDKNRKEITQKNYTTSKMEKFKMSILKIISILRKTILLMIGRNSKFRKTQNRIRTSQKGKRDTRLIKKNSMFSKRGKFENMNEIT